MLDIQFGEVGAKRRLNGTSKVNTQTHRQTDRLTNIWTFRPVEYNDQEGQKSPYLLSGKKATLPELLAVMQCLDPL